MSIKHRIAVIPRDGIGIDIGIELEHRTRISAYRMGELRLL